MKKSIVKLILCLFVLAVLISLLVLCIRLSVNMSNTLNVYKNLDYSSEDELIISMSNIYVEYIVYSIFATMACVATFILIILIALKDLPVFKPLADKLTAHKEKRTQAKAERAEADKQARITALENELEELKKN